MRVKIQAFCFKLLEDQ